MGCPVRVAGLEDKECLSQQRLLLNKRLGLDLAGTLGMDTTSLFNDDDLRGGGPVDPQQTPPASPPLSQVTEHCCAVALCSLYFLLCYPVLLLTHSPDFFFPKPLFSERWDLLCGSCFFLGFLSG